MIVISRIVGGIGNQLFQYASSLAFSRLYGAELYFDLASFQHPKYINDEGFLLEKVFKIEVGSSKMLQHFKTLGLAAPLLPFRFKFNYEKICSHYFVEKSPCRIEERFFSYKGKHCYLEGYWQLEEYFADIRDILLKKLQFNNDAITHTAMELAHTLANQDSVSVHVRRGDYINNKVYNNLYQQCTEKYFREAMLLISARVPDAKIYVFSDDIDWAKEQQIFSGCSFIEYDVPSGSWNDLFLMSCCKHNIIANSSFSWWGAWLNKNPTKIVIGPKEWFRSEELCHLNPIPKNWIQVGLF